MADAIGSAVSSSIAGLQRAERQLTRLQQLRAQPLLPPCPASAPRGKPPLNCR